MERIVALAGNPNVGKSTLFNQLTGLRQHTGNWAGKTVETARGRCGDYLLTDLPGCCSLLPRSEEERVARDFLLRGGAEAVILVCDAGRLRRDLNLALQCRELCPRVLVCVNLLDEAERQFGLAQSNLSSGEENRRSATLGYEAGVVPTSTLLGAQTAWLSAHSEYLDAGIAWQMAAAEMEKVEGNYKK